MTRLEELVIALWNKGMMPKDIAKELGEQQETIENIIETQSNCGGTDGNKT